MDLSELDGDALLGDEKDTEIFHMVSVGGERRIDASNTVAFGNERHAEDALLAATAYRYGAILLTAEATTLPNRARRAGVRVWSPVELVNWAAALPGELDRPSGQGRRSDSSAPTESDLVESNLSVECSAIC